jgi:hypothetical protein
MLTHGWSVSPPGRVPGRGIDEASHYVKKYFRPESAISITAAAAAGSISLQPRIPRAERRKCHRKRSI